MTEWSDHVKKYAKKYKMSYRQSSMDSKCKEAYQKKKKRMSPIKLKIKKKRTYKKYNYMPRSSDGRAGGGRVGDFLPVYQNWQKECSVVETDRRIISSTDIDGLDEVAVGDRLGSESNDAYVRLGTVKSNGLPVAVKFIAEYGNSDPKIEAILASKLGNLAKEDNSLPFPIVLNTGITKVELPSSEEFKKRKESIEKAIYNYNLNTKSNPIAKRRSIEYKKNENLTEPNPGEVKIMRGIVDVTYIVSEKGLRDLNSGTLTPDLIEKAFCALKKLHEQKITHGDPHLGNFLIIGQKDQDPDVLIHDFGNSFNHETKDKYYDEMVKFDFEFLERAVRTKLDYQ